jgi:hypothetical protein
MFNVKYPFAYISLIKTTNKVGKKEEKSLLIRTLMIKTKKDVIHLGDPKSPHIHLATVYLKHRNRLETF